MANKQTMMPPPGGKPAAVIAIGVKPKGDAPPGSDPGDGSGKMSREEAHFVPADHHCKDCANYDPSSGDCSEVTGSFDPEDACLAAFKAMGSSDGGEPDADDMGGPPDGDADDSSMPPGMPQ